MTVSFQTIDTYLTDPKSTFCLLFLYFDKKNLMPLKRVLLFSKQIKFRTFKKYRLKENKKTKKCLFCEAIVNCFSNFFGGTCKYVFAKITFKNCLINRSIF